MDFDCDGPASEEVILQWSEMIDRMEISVQLRLFCAGIKLAKRLIDLMCDLGCRLVAAEDADVLNKDQLRQWEEAHMEYVRLLRKVALVVQGE